MAFDATDFVIDPLTLTEPRARLEYLRDFLRRLPAERFRMSGAGSARDAYAGECGTPACIGGWGRAVFRLETDAIDRVGMDLLGLSPRRTDALFYPGINDSDPGMMGDGMHAFAATPADAADVLDHLLTTGEVDWSVARSEPSS